MFAMHIQDLGTLVVSSDEEGDMPLANGGSGGDVSVDVKTIMAGFPGYQINVCLCVQLMVPSWFS